MSTVISGSIAYDYLMHFPGHFRDYFLLDQIDRVSLSFLVDSMRRQRGGVAPNIAYSMKLLGCDPLILGTVGKDFGEYKAWLVEQGLDLSGVREIDDEYTASFFVNTDEENNQIATFYIGAMAHAVDLSLKDVPRERMDTVVVSPNAPEAMIKHAGEAKEIGVPYVYDPSQQVVRLSKEDLIHGIEGAEILIVNEYEYALIKNKTGLSDEDLVKMAHAVIVTEGEGGSEVMVGKERIQVPAAKPEKIVEPTGVGDAYRAGLLAGLHHNLPWEVCGRLGSLAAVYVLEHTGPQEHHYTVEEFLERYRRTFGNDPRVDSAFERATVSGRPR